MIKKPKLDSNPIKQRNVVDTALRQARREEFNSDRLRKKEKRRTELKEKAKQHFNRQYEKRCADIDSNLDKPIEPLIIFKKY